MRVNISAVQRHGRLWACLAAVAGLLMASSVAAGDGDAPLRVKPGDTPPALLGLTRTNEEVRTTDHAGKVLVTTFWASWCGPCRAEMSALEKIQRIARDQLQVVAVNIEDRNTFREVTRGMHDWQIRLVNDARKVAADAYGVNGIPHMLIIGRDGKVQKVHRGYNEAFLKTLVEDVIAAIEK